IHPSHTERSPHPSPLIRPPSCSQAPTDLLLLRAFANWSHKRSSRPLQFAVDERKASWCAHSTACFLPGAARPPPSRAATAPLPRGVDAVQRPLCAAAPARLRQLGERRVAGCPRGTVQAGAIVLEVPGSARAADM